MKEIFVVSDTHFSHVNSLVFKNELTGEKMRPWTPDQVEEMNETMVKNWNSVVKPHDSVYHLGDVWFTKEGWKILDRLNGVKELVMGNHDDKDINILTKYFRKLHGSITVRSKSRTTDLILTHIPIHTSQFYRFFGNVHGHIHRDTVKLENGQPDPRYLNVCVEMIDYTPVTLDECVRRIAENRKAANFTTPALGRG